jgi:hypothetical protein
VIMQGEYESVDYQHVTMECPASVGEGGLLMLSIDAGRELGIHVQHLERVHDPCDHLMYAYTKL